MLRAVLASIAFWSLLFAITAGFVLLAPPAFLVLRLARGHSWDRLARWCIWAYGRAVARMIGFFCPLDLKGKSGTLGDPPRILVFNHLSFLDLFLITLAVPPDSVCVARQWPFSVPAFGPVMRLGGYPNAEKLPGGELLEHCRALLAKGVSLAVFPEGTRSRTGRPGRFRSGAFKLSVASGTPVRPVRIEGTGDVLPPGKFLFVPGPIAVRILDVVEPDAYAGDELGHAAMRRLARERIVEPRDTARATL